MSLRGVEGWGAAGTSMLVAFGAFAVAQIGLMIPITPGGLVWRSASLVPQIMVGLVALLTWSRQESRALAKREATRRERTGEVES
jgi:uncharacterized membrane protein YbhN (UPF0104 family)